MASEADKKYMHKALELARKGRFKTAPNPLVGSVIVRNGRIIGEGWHRKAGSDHAEIAAMKNAGSSVKGATVYVTLEPCCHTGRTGPCTDALIDAGVRRVVFAATDPDPRVKGKGARRLRNAGIEVSSGVLRRESERLNEIFFAYHRLGRPFIILKTAQTIDGRIASTTGDSKWISSKASRRMAHELRAEVDGVVVGGQTVRRDNPSLTVRHVNGSNPYRIVLTGSLRFPKECTLLDENTDYRTIVAGNGDLVSRFSRSKRGKGVIMWSLEMGNDGFLDVRDLVKQAHQFGLRSLLIEGGNRVATSFLKAGLVDKYIAFIAPKVLGEGVNAVGDLRIRAISRAITFNRSEMVPNGDDMIFVGYPKWSK